MSYNKYIVSNTSYGGLKRLTKSPKVFTCFGQRRTKNERMKAIIQYITLAALITYTIYNKSCENALIDKVNDTETHTYIYKVHKIISKLAEQPELQLKLKDCSDVQEAIDTLKSLPTTDPSVLKALEDLQGLI